MMVKKVLDVARKTVQHCVWHRRSCP